MQIINDPIRRALEETLDAELPEDEIIPFVLDRVPECGKWQLDVARGGTTTTINGGLANG